MLRKMTIAACLGLAAVAAVPASASTTLSDPGCVSLDVSCQGYQCGSHQPPKYDFGWYDTGPWIVIC